MMLPDIRIPIESHAPNPQCGHCGKELEEVVDRRSVSPRTDFKQVLHLLVCPHCNSVLGASVNAEIQ